MKNWLLGLLLITLVFLAFAAPLRAETGEELFAKHCAICHGKDGKAQSYMARKLGVKDLAESKATDSEIIKRVTEGKQDDDGRVKMSAFKDRLTPEEIKSLVPVVKAFRK